MKIFKFILLGIFLSGLLAGCNIKNSVVKVDKREGKGTLMVYRPLNPIWRHKRFSIYIDGKYKDPLMSNSHHIYNLSVGNYVIEIKEDVDLNPEIYKLKVFVKENKTKYLKFGTPSIDGHLKFKRVIKSIAKNDYNWNIEK